MNAQRTLCGLLTVFAGGLLLAPTTCEGAITSQPTVVQITDATGTRAALCDFVVTGFAFQGAGVVVSAKCRILDGPSLNVVQRLATLRGTPLNLYMEIAPMDFQASGMRVQTGRALINIVAQPGTPLAKHLQVVSFYLYNAPRANLNALIAALNVLAQL